MMRLEDYKPSDPAEVSCEQDGGEHTLVFTREIRHSPAKVWAALTEADKLPRWAPYRPSRDLDATGPVTLKMIDGSTPENYESEVFEVVKGERIRYSWGDSGTLEWELQASGKGTRLTLRHTVENPEWISLSAAGWHMCLDFAELLLDGHPIGPLIGEQVMEYGWQKLLEHYKKVLGLEDDADPAQSPD